MSLVSLSVSEEAFPSYKAVFMESDGDQIKVETCSAVGPKMRCRCAEKNKSGGSSPKEGGGCSTRGFGPGRGFCFLEMVADPANPSENCYQDAAWSPTAGRFWSRKACGELADIPQY